MGKTCAPLSFLLSKRAKHQQINKKVSLFLSKSSRIIKYPNREIHSPYATVRQEVASEFKENQEEQVVKLINISTAESINQQSYQFNPPSVSDHNIIVQSDNFTVLESIRTWSLHHNVTRSALADLLKILQPHSCFNNFPLDPRTLLGTPKLTGITSIGTGQFHYFGIQRGLLINLPKISTLLGECICLQFNVDGIPIFKSSSLQFWPILAHVVGSNCIFAVAIYAGVSKPNDLKQFLGEFVRELSNLLEVGFIFRDRKLKVSTKSFICDAPARAFICAIKNHTGYYGCGKCEVKGKYVQNRVVFLKNDIVLRTDESFRSKSQEKHHNGDTPLTALQIDLVQDFPFEYMHLVCLGVTKKILKLWTDGKRLGYRIRPKTATTLSEKLIATNKWITKDFARRPRSLKELDRWKATDFLTVLLYTGPVVLKYCVEEKYFNNFLTLSVAVRLLAEEYQTEENISYAESLLVFFVETFKTLYGCENISYNVHGLIHLADDVRRHGNLDSFSAFKFENHLGQLKRLVRSSNQPLQQIHRRIVEREQVNIHSDCQNDKTVTIKYAEVEDVSPNNLVLLNNGTLVSVRKILNDNSGQFVIGRQFKTLASLFEYPCDSKLLQIFKVKLSDLSQSDKKHSASNIKYKCVAIYKKADTFGIFPLLHSKVKDGQVNTCRRNFP
ncbi:hypothetical protein Fcan01_20218 [Folsomia candida]|uniref:Transposase domain-containing protein n=1 Tax=Folsomia candida TaxID=158441 RepID=A0A226DKE7_FOLCA|nr:hypothetical protein Fcan01_20218 [Folsomia candida]